MLRLIDRAGIAAPALPAPRRPVHRRLPLARRARDRGDRRLGGPSLAASTATARRDAWLLARGYVVIRFTWPQLRDEPLLSRPSSPPSSPTAANSAVSRSLARTGTTGCARPAARRHPPPRRRPPPAWGVGRRTVTETRTRVGKGGVVPDVPTAVLFPGQGSQTPDMRDLVAQREPELLERCLELVGEDPFARVEESTRFQQPAIFCASIAGWRALDLEPQFAAGHSLGELAALAAAGVLTVDDALELVVLRGELMAEADADRLDARARRRRRGRGRRGRRRRRPHRRQRQRARPGRPRGRPRPTSTPPRPRPRSSASARSASRSPARSTPPRWSPPCSPSAPRSTTSRSARPAFTVFSCASAQPFEDVREELAQALIRPVRWRETFTALHDAGAERFVEAGPGKVLARLAKRIVPGTKVETPAEELVNA